MSLVPDHLSAGATTRKTGWMVVFLLLLAQMLNYFDKTVVGVAAPSIMAELHISPERYGLIASSFFSLYAATGIAIAFFAAPRFGARKIMAALLLVWGLSQLPIAFAASFGTLVACRVVLGMGEGAGAPTAMNAVHEWFDDADRNMPTVAVLIGSPAGSLLAAPVLSYIIAYFGWRAAFLACSAAGILLFLLWLFSTRDGPHVATAAAERRVTPGGTRHISQRELWLDPTIIGILVLGFTGYWIVGFSVAWLPIYVRTRLGLGLRSSGWVLSAIYLFQAASLLLIVFSSHRLMRAGKSSRLARGIVMALCMLVSGAAFLLASLDLGPVLSVALVAIGTSFPLVPFTLGSAMVSEVTPAEHRNRAMTIIFSGVTIAAIPAPIVTGRLVANGWAGWDTALLLLAVVALIGGAISWFTLRPDATIRRFARIANDDLTRKSFEEGARRDSTAITTVPGFPPL